MLYLTADYYGLQAAVMDIDASFFLCGPRGGYVGTDIYRSEDPFKWTPEGKVAHFNSHAAEVVRDEKGNWFVNHCGWGKGGVFLAPLKWNDGLDDAKTSLPPGH